MLVPEELQRDFLIYAFRYALGRATYAPHDVIGVLRGSWSQLNEHDRNLFKREIRQALTENRAGHDFDRREWATIFDLD